jgi:phosphoglycolate phosphatase
MIRCLVFDFDGTLVPSNSVKRDAYAVTVGHIPGASERVAAILTAKPHIDRHGVFAQLCSDMPACGAPAALAARYGTICHDTILPMLRTGPTRALLEGLRARGLGLHVASATPEGALLRLFDDAGLTPLLDSIRGVPHDKRAALADIIAGTGLTPQSVAVVGDGDNDREAAMANGCLFIRVNGDASQLHGGSVESALRFLADRITSTLCGA